MYDSISRERILTECDEVVVKAYHPEFLICSYKDIEIYFNPKFNYGLAVDIKYVDKDPFVSYWTDSTLFFAFLLKFYRNNMNINPDRVCQKIKHMYLDNDLELPKSWHRFDLVNKLLDIRQKAIEGKYSEAGQS